MNKPNIKNSNIIFLWLGLVIISLFSRSYIPIDETRYVTVAWNMWLNHNYLVPYLNGETYSHKPPLLFWLMNIGWKVLGLNDWSPRLLPSFFAISSVFITQNIAKRLWPDSPQIAFNSSLILLGSALWTVFTTATMFDMLVAFFTVLGMLGVLIAYQERSLRGWILISVAIGGGLLSKGPTILLQILPLALLAPWWTAGGSEIKTQKKWGSWYLKILIVVIVGSVIVLSWAIPAGISGGAKYQHEIFWGQTADRMVKSFAHRRPVYWYLPMLPVMLFPWLFALPVWRALAKIPLLLKESGVRFCISWFVPVFIAFSLISGKQPHYLLPIFPAFALICARGLKEVKEVSFLDIAVLAFSTILVGTLLIYLPIYDRSHHLAPWIKDIPLWSGLILIAGPMVLFFNVNKSVHLFTWRSTLLSGLLVSVLYLGVIKAAGNAYDIRGISYKIKEIQNQGLPIANVGKYHGQYNFIGRLDRSPDVVEEYQLADWFAAHPNGRIIMYFGKGHPLGISKPDFLQNYLGDQVGILSKDEWSSWTKTPHVTAKSESDMVE